MCAAVEMLPRSTVAASFIVVAMLDLGQVMSQCPKKDIKCIYPVLKEFDPSGIQLLGHASCLRRECPNLVDDDKGESKDVVLKLHNELRQKIALGEDVHFRRTARTSQGAGNMLQMVWDDNLAENAMNWAFQLCLDRGIHTFLSRQHGYCIPMV